MSKQKIDISKGRYWDRAWSLIDGCTPCSPGCDHCWSASLAHRYLGGYFTGVNYYSTGNIQFCGYIVTNTKRLDIPLKRKKPTVYSIWNDLFHEAVDIDFQYEAYQQMTLTPHHTFIVLTKRPHIMAENFNEILSHLKRQNGQDLSIDNVWHGLTVCNQQEAEEKLPDFLCVPGKKFLSIEPMLSDIRLVLKPTTYTWEYAAESGHLWGIYKRNGRVLPVDACILGGETGPGARPIELDWIRSVRDQCEAAGVPFFLKHIDKKHSRILDGKTHDDLPWVGVENAR